MIHFDLPKQKSSIIKVLGVGGGGSNAVNFMFDQGGEGVDFIICNTDAKALEQSRVHNKIQLVPHLTQGLGAGANPEVGKQATEESLEEIRRILEVNTKMAFITAGMGGGTGTGGAPIISKICKDLNILTVGIVTTPFAFEGPRRLKQAEAGIRELQPHVDTLLVISNDKLRMQFGNLKMTEAFGKADNVLATAARCITDIINSKGTIIVDFADVCTVMRNGGVAILGNATAEGEDRAQRGIEEALNSPLLNDNDIRGAKWILVNINSAEGEFECSMDEFEIINNYLRMQSGENTDLIIGMGHDKSLGKSIGITLIATGFEYKDPFAKKETAVPKMQVQKEVKEEKIVMTLGVEGDEKKMYSQPALDFKDEAEDAMAPKLVEVEMPKVQIIPPVMQMQMRNEEPVQQKDEAPLHFELSLPAMEKPVQIVKKEEPIQPAEPVMQIIEKEEPLQKETPAQKIYAGGFLSKPANIYAVENNVQPLQQPIVPQPAMPAIIEEQKAEPVEELMPVQMITPAETIQEEETEMPLMFLQEEISPEENTEFQLVMKDEERQAPQPVAQVIAETDLPMSEEEEQKRRAAERISKLRNLSFNMNSNEAAAEYDSVPAYVRRNMELYGNTLTTVEQFYSKYTVKKDENDETQISSINTFLDGKKPD